MKRARTRNNIESPTHIQIEREIKLARTIPMRNASENHISGSWVSCSCMRLGLEGIAACIVVFHHSIELKGLDTICWGLTVIAKALINYMAHANLYLSAAQQALVNASSFSSRSYGA